MAHYLRKKERVPGPKSVHAAPFFVVLALLTLVSFIIPLRPTRSNMEKRDLASFPEFSVDALASGDYFSDISLWFSDTFPGRESWISMASYVTSFHGHSEISIEGDLPEMETVPPVLNVPEPEQTRPTEGAPGEEPAGETQPEEPTEPEDTWGGVDAGDGAEILQSSAVIQIGDAVFSAQGFSQENSDKYVAIVNRFAAEMKDKGITVVSAPPPTAVGILIEEEYQEKLKCVSQDQILQYLHGAMDSSIVKVDTVNALLPHNGEYIYFRTDHHWTALGAYYAYDALCQALNMESVDISTMEVWNQGDFVGSLYGKASRPHKLRIDTVDAYVPEGDIVNTVYNKNGFGTELPILQDTTNREKNTKYLVFGTDYPMTHAENRSLPDAPNCLVIKDSFGNCFIPFLTQNFNNVYAVDYRKFRQMPLTQFVDQYDIDYVIFMPYITASQAVDGPPMLKRLCFAEYG